MPTTLKLHELTGSPNSVKIRIALAYKGLDYERLPIALDAYPGDRSAVVALSRQPRLPVLQHGSTVLFDSGAIVRYLEANFPEAPSLFTDDHQTFPEIERWELFAKTQFGPPIGALFGQAFSPQQDPAVIAKANEQLNECLGPIEDRLSGHEFLVGDHLTMADIACATPLYLADQTAEMAGDNPIAAFFHQNLKFGSGREKTQAWVRRVVAHDPIKGRR